MEHSCTTTRVLAGTDLGAPSASQALLDLPINGRPPAVAVVSRWRRRHRGQLVSRLPHVHGGGDYIVVWPERNGLADYDSHGTVVAGIIGGAPSETDGFSGWHPTPISSRSASRQRPTFRQPVSG
jgi:membrane-anchored mycosin MYCP